MDFEGNPLVEKDYGSLLRRVGVVAIIYGALTIVLESVEGSSGANVLAGDGIAAIVAGVFLWKRNLHSVPVIRLLAAVILCAETVSMLGIIVLYPSDLMPIYLRLTPWGDIFLKYGPDIAGILVAWWVYMSLGVPRIKTAVEEEGKDFRRWWLQPWAGFIFGGIFSLLFMGMVFHGLHGEIADRAVERAASRYGNEYRYCVTALSTNHVFGGDTSVHAVLLKYTDTSIEPVTLDWSE